MNIHELKSRDKLIIGLFLIFIGFFGMMLSLQYIYYTSMTGMMWSSMWSGYYTPGYSLISMIAFIISIGTVIFGIYMVYESVQ